MTRERVVTAAMPVSGNDGQDVDVLGALPPVVRAKPRIVWDYAIVVVGVHVLALLACVPWFFSWTGVILMLVGTYVYGGLGINLCYHRLLSHRAFKCPVWLERFFVFIALCCMQDAPGRWVAAHRIHHKFADDEPDPHSPLISFLWSHIGWLMVDKHGLNKIANYERYARDLLRQPFYLNLERQLVPIIVYLGHWVLYFAAGFIAGVLMRYDTMACVQFGLSLMVWGAIVRTVTVWHITWTVNSLTHMFGYRNYNTDEASRNNWFVALISSGEGWHNNHHADPAAANNSRRWWEIDLIYGVIWLLEKFGLAWDVVKPREQRRADNRPAQATQS
ncbi:MAG TPA: fatty acid desaturase [Phycisphaerales bacterium]|nr:fatty acid desaturase [Phycisphaerales bacterium]